jgi:hypothetical protein
MKELTRFEIAAVKRIAANTKTLRGKVEKLNAKIAELNTMKETYLNEIAMWESPITAKYGYSVEEILDGTYLLPTDCEACDTYTEECNTEYVETVEESNN